MDCVFVIFIAMMKHISFLLDFFVLEELHLMLHI